MEQSQQTQHTLLPDLPNPDPTPADGIDIGESPLPGVTLKRILRGHSDAIHRVAWSPDGRFLASPSRDKSIHIWDVGSGENTAVLHGHKERVNSVAWSPDGRLLASASMDKTIRVWDLNSKKSTHTLTGHTNHVYCVRWSPNGRLLASGSLDQSIILWDTESWQPKKTLKGHGGYGVASLLWTPDGQLISGGAYADHTIRLWDIQSGECLKVLRGHNQAIQLAWAAQPRKLISASLDRTIRIWDTTTWQPEKILEAHSDEVVGVSTTADGHLFASKSVDNTVRLWTTHNLKELAKISETTRSQNESGVAFHPHLPLLATLGQQDNVIRVWQIDTRLLIPQAAASSDEAARYTTAKLVLVGDSGVGKTGLGWRLAHNEFKVQDSTHGQQFWPVPDLSLTLEDGTQCEAVLWDLAGQDVYRPVHTLFLDNIDTALILFDPTIRLEPLKGVTTWLENLKGKAQLPPSILVGARTDVGQPVLSREELDNFCREKGITGGYISTSAKDGRGIEELLDRLRVLIPWKELVTTVTTRTFKRIKDYVLSLKEKPNHHSVLVNLAKLRRQLQATDPFWEFTDDELVTAVSHLENHGYLTFLKSVSGEEHILLAPDLLPGLVASIVLQADNDPHELGSISETDLLQGSHSFTELQGLDQNEQRVLLDAAVLRLIENNICFREKLEGNILLIFPAFIKQKRPLLDTTPTTDDITYLVRGRIENLYASLVVRLSYTTSFNRLNQWQKEVQFQTQEGHICGFRFNQEQEGEIELVLNYSSGIPEAKKLEFESLFEQLLYKSDVTVTPYPPIYCPNGHLQERQAVVNRQQSGKDHLFCHECGQKIILFEIAESSNIGLSAAPWLQYQEAKVHLHTTYQGFLLRIKSYRRGYPAPNCYISRLPQQEQFAARLRQDLNEAGLFVIEDPNQVRPGDFILILSTPAYDEASTQQSELLKHDIPLIRNRYNLHEKDKNLIALDLEANPLPPHDLNGCRPGNFTIDTHYEVSLFDLILDLYRIPFDAEACAPLRQALHQQWQESLMDRKKPPRAIDVSELLAILSARLRMEEVEMITFGLVDDFDNIPGNTKISKIRGAIQYFQHRDQLEMFLNKLARHRPDINLTSIYKKE